MSELKKRRSLWSRLPIIGGLISVWQKERATPCYCHMGEAQAHPDLLPYPIDMFPLLALPSDALDKAGVLYNAPSAAHTYHPTHIAQYALAHWDAYLANGENEHKEAFMAQARWLLVNELHLSDDAGGWPILLPSPAYHASQPWLSALTQGNVISVLVRAYQLTSEDAFLLAARRAVRTFELDILDGGVSTPLVDNGIFFEEIAVYPTAHVLNGYMLALLGLYDYVTLTKDSSIEALIQRSVTTLHLLLDAFDSGYWTRSDLLHKRLAPWFYHSLHVTLLEVLAKYSGCEHCAALAARWAGYQCHLRCRLRYLIASRATTYYDNMLKPGLRRFFFSTAETHSQAALDRVCVQISALLVAGGVLSVLTDVAEVMKDQWHLVYLTQYKGQGGEGLEIEEFGRRQRLTSPWQFPQVWFYCLAGWGKLFSLMRHGSGYRLFLPQDAVFSGAFAALLGKMAGVRVVCMDHGTATWFKNPTLSWFDNPTLRKEWMRSIRTYPWQRRLLFRLQLVGYWPSVRLLERVATHCSDQFLVAGDDVADIYRKHLGVHPSRIIRYPYMVDVARFTPPDRVSRVSMRAEQGVAEDAILITLITRLSPEKGLDFAMEGIALALAALPPKVQKRVRVFIAGEGPMRSQLEADIRRHSLEGVCTLWGEAKPADVVMLLGIADIYLYSGTRGAGYSIAMLEAMAASCAVVTSAIPQSHAKLVAEGRGIAVMPSNAMEIGTALVRLCGDPVLCQQTGQMAREYVATYHTAQMLKRSLLRASFFQPTISDRTSNGVRVVEACETGA